MGELTIGSLFAGIGGLELGLERAGMRTVWQVEIDDYARKVLERHWPDALRFRDVRSVGAHNLPPVDVICGGFPCQDISLAGKGAGLAGERSGLWVEFARIVRELRPRYVVVENVAALLSRGLGEVLGDLAACGYDAEWDCIPAAAVGAPHIRDRLFVVAYAQRPDPDTDGARFEEQHAPPFAGGPRFDPWPAPAKRGHWSTEPDVGRVADGVPSRVDRLRCLGNAVVPQVAELIGRRIVAMEVPCAE